MDDRTIETPVSRAAPNQAGRASLRQWLERLLPFASLLVLFILLSIVSPYFLTVTNLSSVARQSAVINILALGMTLIMVSGGIDLSVGSVMAFSGICGTMVLQSGAPLYASVAGGMLAGAGWGLGELVLLTLLRVGPFFSTRG